MKIEVKDETIPCKICEKPTPMLGTKLCNNCWEVERRLDDYLKTPKGRKNVYGGKMVVDSRYLDQIIFHLDNTNHYYRLFGLNYLEDDCMELIEKIKEWQK